MRITKIFLSALAALALTVTTAQADSLHKVLAPGHGHGKPVMQEPVRPHHPAPIPGPMHRHKMLHGNVASKIYHANDCDYYSVKGRTLEFADARQAERAGFRACKFCEGKEGVATAKKEQRRHHDKAGYRLHANPDSKTVHGPSCKFYNARSSSERFASVDQARKHGYHPCVICGGK